MLWVDKTLLVLYSLFVVSGKTSVVSTQTGLIMVWICQ